MPVQCKIRMTSCIFTFATSMFLLCLQLTVCMTAAERDNKMKLLKIKNKQLDTQLKRQKIADELKNE